MRAVACSFTLAVATALGGCASVVPASAAELGQPFALAVGERAEIAETGTLLFFDAVVEDSRCPVDVTCVWAGNARVRLLATKDGAQPLEVLLNTHGGGSYPGQACAGDVTIELVALEPLPAVGRGDADRDAAAITATLIAERGCDQLEAVQIGPATAQPVPSAAPYGAAAAVVAFHAALAAGDADRALALLAPETVVFEAGGAELSRAEYAAHHLAADMEFAAAVAREVIDVRVDELGDVAWVASRTRARGTFRERAIDASGVETMVLVRRAGEWRIVHIHWSSRAAR